MKCFWEIAEVRKLDEHGPHEVDPVLTTFYTDFKLQLIEIMDGLHRFFGAPFQSFSDWSAHLFVETNLPTYISMDSVIFEVDDFVETMKRADEVLSVLNTCSSVTWMFANNRGFYEHVLNIHPELSDTFIEYLDVSSKDDIARALFEDWFEGEFLYYLKRVMKYYD